MERLDAKLHVVHVQQKFEEGFSRGFLQPQLDSINPELLRQLEENREAEVTRIRERLTNLTPPDQSYELRWGSPIRELLDIAPAYDLIVMGAHGAGRFDTYFLGGLTGRLVRRSPVPVLTVRRESGSEHLQRILVATDLGEASRHAWRFCLQLAAAGVRLVPAHVIDDPRVQDDPNYIRQVSEALLELAQDSAERHIVREGNPVSVLPEMAEEVAADAIAIGIHHHSDALGLLFGSRADALLRSSPIPILSIPLQGDKTP